MQIADFLNCELGLVTETLKLMLIITEFWDPVWRGQRNGFCGQTLGCYKSTQYNLSLFMITE